MNTKLLSLLAAAALLGLAGCNKAESPAEVQNDVANARQEAGQEINEAQADRADEVADANQQVNEASDDASKQVAGASYDVAIEKAEGAVGVPT